MGTESERIEYRDRDLLFTEVRTAGGEKKARERGAPKVGAGSLSDDAEHGREEHPRGAGSLSGGAGRGREEHPSRGRFSLGRRGTRKKAAPEPGPILS